MNKCIVVLLILFSTCMAARAQDTKQLTVHLSQPGKLFTLNVNIGRAAIQVTGYNGNDVIIGVETTITQGRERAHVTARENNNDVTIEAQERTPVKLDIKVPQTAGIFKLSSVNGGAIRVSDVTGNLELQNKSGGISATNISGSVIAGTLSGPVTVSFKQIDPAAVMSFTTLSGAINVSFPPGLKADLKIKSDNGKVYSDFALVSVPGHPAVYRDEKDGAWHLPADDWIYGIVGGGGPEFLFKNTTGNIHIWKGK